MSFIKPTRNRLIAPAIILLFFLLMLLGKALIPQQSVSPIFLYPFLFALFLSIPFWHLLKPLGLWSSVAVWDSSGPTAGGFIVVAIVWALVFYLISCLVSYLCCKKKRRSR